MNDFDYDIMQKKKLSRMGKYKKIGTKSKKCPLSTDNLTRRQWERKCGDVEVFKLGEPMVWTEFKKLSVDLQRQYLLNLIAKYKISSGSLSKMFGVNQMTIRRHIATKGVNVSFNNNRMNKEQKEEWDKFICGEISDDIKEDIYSGGVCDEVKELEIDTNVIEEKEEIKTRMQKFSLVFVGEPNVDMIANSMRQLIGDAKSCKIEVICEL